MLKTLFNLEGKRVLITGGAQGIGAAMAKCLGEAGAALIINGRNPKKLEQAVNRLNDDGLEASGVLFDVNESAAIKKAVDDIEKNIGSIDILINNAGIIKRAPAEDLEEEDWNSVIRTNLTSPFLLSKYVGKYMIARNAGKIINICSLMSE